MHAIDNFTDDIGNRNLNNNGCNAITLGDNRSSLA